MQSQSTRQQSQANRFWRIDSYLPPTSMVHVAPNSVNAFLRLCWTYGIVVALQLLSPSPTAAQLPVTWNCVSQLAGFLQEALHHNPKRLLSVVWQRAQPETSWLVLLPRLVPPKS